MRKLIGLFPSLCALALLLATGACSKDNESLLVVALTANPGASGLTSATIAAGGRSKTFALADGLSQTTPTSLGVYLPASVTGSVTVTATATGGGECYRGMKSVTIPNAGATVNVALVLTPAATCAAADGGAGAGGGGSGGTTGAGGAAAGSGGGGTTGAAGANDGGAAGTNPGTDGGAGTGAGGTAAAGRDGGAGTGAAGTGAAGTNPVLVWGVGENLEKDPVTGSYWPTVAIEPTKGSVLVAWTEGDFPAVKRYDPSLKTWSTTKILDQRGSVQDVTVAMDDAGHALVVWTQYEATPTPALRGLWGVVSVDRGVTWSMPGRIHDGVAWAVVAIGMDAAGNARVAWDETTAGNIRTLWSAAYDVTTRAWVGAAAVKAGTNSWDHFAHIAVAPTGAGILVFNQVDPINSEDDIWGATFTKPNAALAPPVQLDNFVGNDTWVPSVAISADGTRGIVVWEQDTTLAGEIWENSWTSTAGFAGAKKALMAPSLGEPAVTMDRSYTTTLVWTQAFTGDKWNMMSSRRVAGGAWGAPTPLETTNQAPGQTNQYSYAQIGSDRAGNVQVLWRRKVMATGNTFSVVARQFSANAWQPEVVLGLKAGLPAYIFPQLAVAEDGRAAAAFYYGDPDQTGDPDTFNIFVALFR